jgi:hypothetical protein
MRATLHGLFGLVALLCVATFWMSTIVSEVFMSTANVAAVKNGVLAGMWVLIPAMAATGLSGLASPRRGRLTAIKTRRMKIAAANGLLVLMPSAYLLASLANAGRFDSLFYAIQTVELVAGGVNLTLLLLNARDGLRLSGRFSSRRARTAAAH